MNLHREFAAVRDVVKNRIGLLLLLVALGMVSWASSVARAASGDPGYPTGGQIQAQGYNRDRQTAAFRAGLTTADSTTLSVTLATLVIGGANDLQVNGRPTITVSARFSTSATNTCQVRIIWLYIDSSNNINVLGSSPVLQANATTLQDQTTNKFMAPDLYFDGHGATDAFVQLVTAPTGGGSVDLWVGTF